MPLPDTLKIAVSLILIAPLAFFMGLPFPLALVRVAAARPGLVPWAWGINGCAFHGGKVEIERPRLRGSLRPRFAGDPD